ncbi:MAG TPA: TIR domain-containing protein [Thermoanaerobaculia bacterium]
MLKPKCEIGIVYGHRSDLREAALEAIAALAAGGYRVRPRILTAIELRRENTTILDALLTTFHSLDAAIVFMTADDLGLGRTELSNLPLKELSASELVARLRDRSRQNVILELGLLIGYLGQQRVRLFGPRNLEYPSDIQGLYIADDLTREGVHDHVRQIIEERLGLEPTTPLLRDPHGRLSYANIAPVNSNTLNTFATEFDRLEDDADERIAYLLERVVFESYLQVEPEQKWWSRRLADIRSSDKIQSACKQLLRLVTDYMAWWRPPELKDFVALESCALGLEGVIETLGEETVTPMAKIVAYDYLGLSYDKLAQRPGVDKAHRRKFLDRAADALAKCLELAALYDDQDLRLWTGYALFNLARVEQQRGAENWREMVRSAVSIRSSWQRAGHIIPADVEEGLIAEYFHAAATLVEFDETLSAEEVALLYSQYEDWRSSARNRVRLAKNVADTWRRILARQGSRPVAE